MNGRVYDYRLGRFLSVDPIISNPADSQSLNPYSYIGNNPLSGVDPTGYAPAGMLDCQFQACQNIAVNINVAVEGSGGATAPNAQQNAGGRNSGATGQGSALPAGTPSETGSAQQTARPSLGDWSSKLSVGEQETSWQAKWGTAWGLLTAHIPLGLGTLLPNLSSDPDFVASRWQATLLVGALQIGEGVAGGAVGTGVAAGSAATGPGAAVGVPVGLVIDAASAVVIAGGAANVVASLGHIQEMRGSGSGGSKPPRTEETPTTDPDSFRPVRGTNAKTNTETGEVWVRDQLHKDHYEVYRNMKDFENGARTRDVWLDGRPKRTF